MPGKYIRIKGNKISMIRFILGCMIYFIPYVSFSQQDSLYIYEQIKNRADKSRFGRWVYDAIFVEPKPKEYPVKPASKEEKIVNPYLKYENHIIRNIYTTVYDPFGHSINDTSSVKINSVQRTGNNLHITTRRWVILNKLLFKKNDALDPLSLSESERLLRQTGYVSDARIFVTRIHGSDSVDVNVIVQDKWTVSAPVLITDVKSNIKLRNQNFLGQGHQFEQYIGYTKPDIMDYSGYYNIANIDNTYISSQLSYQTNRDGTGVGLSFDRPFYSPLAKWAGGLSLGRGWKYFSYQDTIDGPMKRLPLNSYGYDVWLGKSFKINAKRKFFDQSTNFIVGERYFTNIYDKRPSFTIDAGQVNLNTASFIGNLGFSVQQFYKEKFVYRFGANEDVPQGLIFQFLYGAVKKEYNPLKYYLGFEIARAKHFRLGYFSATFSYGMFFNKSMANDITTNYKLNYFSDLFRIGKWYLREFVNGNLVYGIDKPAEEKITITSGDLYGFNSGNLEGNSKLILNCETVAYAPYNLIGFRFAPVLLAGFGMIGDKQKHIPESNLYQGYSLGLMVRNENLISSTFQVSFGFYPFLPNGQNNVFTYNPVTSFTLRIRAFSVSQPDFLAY